MERFNADIKRRASGWLSNPELSLISRVLSQFTVKLEVRPEESGLQEQA